MNRSKFATLISLAVLSACVLQPAWKSIAKDADFHISHVNTDSFRHLVISNETVASLNPTQHLQVYIEGDGTPWIRPDRVAIDPTPVNPVMLRMMQLAESRAIYLGRPCYFGLATSSGCESGLWTFERYSQPVIDSMCAAVNSISAGADSVELLGYSGGGAIVMRMGACTEKLVQIVTLAGNLDPAAWTQHHSYSPLTDTAPEISIHGNGIRTIHLQCRHDTNVPPSITEAWFRRHQEAIRHIVDDCSHASGWEDVAPPILDEYPLN